MPLVDSILTQARLTEARAAYHKLQTGSLRETVDHNGTRITYTRADAASLKQYIEDLEGALAGPRQRRRAIYTVY